MSASLTFAGGAGTVTGSKYLIENGTSKLLLDCGMFQGLKPLRLRNWARPSFDPRAIDAVVISHGHLDHAGYLPLLVREGYRGPVHCTSATADLLGVLLRDSAHIQEEDARRANRYGYSKHHPALPLYTLEDAERALELVVPHRYGDGFDAAGTSVLFRRAGHILGAATVELVIGEPAPIRLVFSGDLGRWDRPILRDPELVPAADVLLVESTYGDKEHPPGAEDELVRVVLDSVRRGGALIVPSFAIERAQELLWWLRRLREDGRIPALPVYLDSPMAAAVTGLYCRHPEDHDHEMLRAAADGNCPLCDPEYKVCDTADDSRALNGIAGPVVIIAGSGMATGGRVLHHLAHRIGDERTTVLLAGYQAAGTRGRSLQDGATTIRIHGADLPVRARVEMIDGLSAHADRKDLLRWLRGFRAPPAHTYVVHGEAAPSRALAAAIRDQLGWEASVAEDGARISLPPRRARKGAS